MKVILTAEVKDIGQAGDEKEVKPGFARNFLLPRGLAVLMESAQAQTIIIAKEKDELKKSNQSQKMKDTLKYNSKIEIFFKRKAKGNKLFGSVKSDEILKEIAKKINLTAKKIEPDKPIKTTGEFIISAVFSAGERTEVVVNVEAIEEKELNK